MGRRGRAGAAAAGAAMAGVTAYDLLQKRHAILRNFPVVGHFRYMLESLGPELRQYIVTSNDEERPFSRDQRRWVYASSKRQINTFGFGTDNDVEDVQSLLVIEAAPVPARRRPQEGTTGLGPGVPAAAGEGARRRARPPPRVPPALGRELLGDELRLAVAGRRRGDQPRRGRRAVPAQHRRGRPRARRTATAAT